MWEKIITPRFHEMDALKHINNCVLPIWFDLGREEMYFNFLRHSQKCQPLMARTNIDFLKQIRYGSDVLIKTFIKKIGTASFTTYQEVWQKGELTTKGEGTMVYYDMEKAVSKPIPDDVREEFAKHMLDKDHPGLSTRSTYTSGAKG